MSKIGIIGGSGFYEFPELENQKKSRQENVYGVVEDIIEGQYVERDVIFIPRHGSKHAVPPHKVNYRANIEYLSQQGVDKILAFNAVGGIGKTYSPGKLVLPDQLIDYTFAREHTFFDGLSSDLEYADFTQPFDLELSKVLEKVLQTNANDFIASGTYACMQGPRLETAAEINKLKKDGNQIVGMTLMPEAVLARERKISYCSLCLVVNWAAGVKKESFSLNSILALLNSSVPLIREIFLKTIRFL